MVVSKRSKVGASRKSATVGKKRPGRILLAEDDPDMRVLLALTLEADGFDVVQVDDGARLVHQIGSVFLKVDGGAAFDLIISDVRMPKLSGMDVLAALRRIDDATPVIIITAFGDDAVHAEARRLGASAVLDKPFDIDELRAEVHRIVPQEYVRWGLARSRNY